MWLWYWNTAATVANQFLGALLQCRRAALGGAELPVHFRPIAGSEVDLNFNKAIMRTRWDREEDVRADYDHVAREELMYWEEEARAHAEASRSAVPDVTSAQANSLAIELHQRKVERATIAVAAAAGVAGWKAGQEAILRHLEDDVRRLQREDDRLRGELHKVQFRTASIVVQRMSAVHVLRDQNYRDEPDAHGHLRKPSASPRPSRPAGPSAEPFPLPPYPVRPEFEEVPAIIPVTSGAASPRRNLRAAPPVTGVRPAVELARFDDVYTLFRGEWAAGGAERGTVAGVYRALQAGGVRVSEHCWLPDGRLQLTVAPRTPLPRVVAVAGALGCACFAQDGAELALEGLNDTL
ncbi:hypothetical protein DIPPA_04446 [Diplonema papillatum]|nr:hypothetical protein DIPPA_04446 [Diplonema papillatum]